MKTTSLFCSVLISLFILPHPASGQGKKQPASCPAVNLTAPDSAEAGKQVVFTVNIAGGEAQVSPTYNWAISAGTIIEGQGTSVIKVDLKEVAGDSSVTATVEVGGYNPACPSVNSSTVMVLPKVAARKMDEYGKLPPNEQKKRLDNFAIELMNDPTAQGYVIVYGGRTGQATEAQTAARKIQTDVVKTTGLPANRLVLMNGGYREEFAVELWLAPTGATPPEPTPTISESEIKSSNTKKPTKSKAAPQRKS